MCQIFRKLAKILKFSKDNVSFESEQSPKFAYQRRNWRFAEKRCHYQKQQKWKQESYHSQATRSSNSPWTKIGKGTFLLEDTDAYLWGILGQWDILPLSLTSIGFTNCFRCLIFDPSFFTNADVVTIKDETRKFVKPKQILLSSIGFTIFFYTSHLWDFFFTNAAIVTFKDETSK